MRFSCDLVLDIVWADVDILWADLRDFVGFVDVCFYWSFFSLINDLQQRELILYPT